MSCLETSIPHCLPISSSLYILSSPLLWYSQSLREVDIESVHELCKYLMDVSTHMYVYVYIYVMCSHVCEHLCLCTYRCLHTHTLTCMYLCFYTLECEHINVCVSVCVPMHVSTCVCVSMCIPINVYEYIWMCLHTLCFSARQWMFALLLAKSCSRQIMCFWFSLRAKRIHQSS